MTQRPALLFVALAACATGASAQQRPDSAPAARPAVTYPNVRITGRLQSQFYWFGNHDVAATTGPESDFFVRSARIVARGNLLENVAFVIEPSFEGGRSLDVARGRGGVRLRDAFIDVRLTPPGAPTTFTLRMGQEKRPFSRYELLSEANLPSIEHNAGSGLLARSTNDVFGDAGFVAHDVGASAYLTADHERFTLRAGVYNGQGESAQDRNDAKSFGARASYTVWRKLNVAASAYSHDYIGTPPTGTTLAPDSSRRVNALEGDAMWGAPGAPGLFALVEAERGKAASWNREPIGGLDAMVAWHVRTGHPGLLWAWEPVAFVDRANPNRDGDDVGETIVGAGIAFYLSSAVHLRTVFERQSFGSAVNVDPISGVRSQLSVIF